MTRARDVANVLSTATALATDTETAAAISSHNSASDPHGDRANAATLYAPLSNPTFTTIGGDEGGQINFGVAATNTTLSGPINLDVWRNRVRLFEGGGNNRGAFIDLSTLSNGVGSELIAASPQSGNSGKYLTTNGTTASWATLPSSGKVLQVVYAETGTVTTTTSGSYVDVTNLAATITPASTSSKILVFVEMQVSIERDNYPNCGAKLLRGSTAIVTKTDIFTSNQGSTSPNGIPKFVVSVPIIYLDSPSTTASTTYKMQVSLLATGVNGTVSANGSIFGGSPHSSITLLEIGA